ncbi:uncharacterized protein LOC135220673 [Macrobrachium nipponense]|uniref:uncharacterized protein LOC135220673 n=1 Tax=Macrobrachium nipponense TaxID=159736 RepID=UPI0030C8920E
MANLQQLKAVLLLVLATGSEANGTEAQSVLTPTAKPNDTSAQLLEETVSPASTTCAIRAIWRLSSHVMCFHEGRCRLYSVASDAAEQTDIDEGHFCWRVEGRTLKATSSPEGGDDSPCNDGYTMALEIGCVHIAAAMDWYKAKEYCIGTGGQLMEPKNFTALQVFLEGIEEDQFWVAVRARKWLSGASVTRSQWAPGEPNEEMGACARMKKIGDPRYALADKDCLMRHKAICVHY